MPAPSPIDFQPYARPPRVDTLGGYALSIRLLRAAPKEPSRPVAKSLKKIRAAALALQEEAKSRIRVRPDSMRPLDAIFDKGWTALRDRLAAWDKVHSKDSAQLKERAQQLLALYFPNGVAFVLLALEQEWVASQQLLEMIDEDGNADELDKLAGHPAFLANVREQHAALGAALGLAGRDSGKEPPSTSGVAERVSALAQAIADYTRRLAGEVDTEDPASVAAFRRAVRPLDLYREGNVPKPAAGDTAEDAVDPNAPVPDVPEPSA